MRDLPNRIDRFCERLVYRTEMRGDPECATKRLTRVTKFIKREHESVVPQVVRQITVASFLINH